MNSVKFWKHVLVACAVAALAGCSGAEGPMGPEGPPGQNGQDGAQGEKGEDGAAGKDGTSCTVTDNGGGKKTIACGDATVVVNDGTAGENGAAGTSCMAKEVEGVKTVECTDGSKFTIADGADGEDGAAGTSCTAKSVDGVNTVECTDGTSFTVLDGAKGDTGDAGTSCAVEDTETGATITCGDVSVLVADGAKGDTGAVGPQGPVGPSAAQVFNLNADAPASLALSVTAVDVTGTQPVVSFKLINDKTGLGAVGIKGGSSGWIRFGMAQLKAGVDGNVDMWSSYVRSTSGAGTTERGGTLVDNGDGTYQYTFAQDIKATTNPVFDANATQRLFIQMSGTPAGTGVALPYVNAIYDFVPAGGAVTASHDVASTAACNECHGQLRLHGSRIEVKYCTLCHNADLIDDDNGNRTVDMAQMTHGIHAAHMRTTEYKIGTRYAYGEVTYPQALNLCKKCHDGAVASTPQGGNWAKIATKEACGACHDGVDFATHMGGQPDNKKCWQCHDENNIPGYHAGENNSPNATMVIAGASNFTYEVKSVTMADDTHPVITFKITRDGVAIDPTVAPTDLTGGPSFLLAYALPQDGIDEPADWNNKGNAAAQPKSVSLANLRAGTAGTLAAAADEGYYTATLTGTNAFPAGATLRAIGLQGYFTQTAIPDHGNVGRHTVAAWAPVTDDAVRRSPVDSNKCANCHEWFEGHGGNRVRTVEVCAMCHVPNLTSSGRSVDPAVSRTRLTATGTLDALEAAGYDADDPLTFPEQNQGLKDMLHAAHGAAKRTVPFTFVRDRGTSGVFYYDFSEITFPNEYNTCLSCHKPAIAATSTAPAQPATFTVVPEGALWSTQVTKGVDASTTALVLAARSSLPNATDLVTSPWAATCSSCHDSVLATAHMVHNGSKIAVERSEIPGTIETCALCHGAGREADVTVSHGAK